MKTILCISAVCTLGMANFVLNAQETSILEVKLTATDLAVPVTQLFNGKDLTGWKKVGGTADFKVEDGCIVGYGTNVKGNTFLRTEKTYTDFIFSADFKFDHLEGNSGIMFRGLQKNLEDDNGRVHGYQCEADNKSRAWTSGLYDEFRRGWLYPTKHATSASQYKRAAFTSQGNRLFKWDDWNTITIRCEGNRIQTWLNGELRVDFIDTHKEHDTREGFFGLQVHNGKACAARWKNISVRELLAPAPAE